MRVLKVLDEPALLVCGRSKTLIVADVHLGICYLDRSIVNELKNLFEKTGADELVIAGDFKHSISARSAEVNVFRELEKEIPTTLVRGNHDGGIESVRELVIGKVGIFHGHLRPGEDLESCRILIAGHAHPAVLIRHGAGGIKERVWLEGECEFWEGVKKSTIIMPAFNELCASTAVNVEKPPGIFKLDDVKNMEATMLDGTFLGRVCSI